MRRLKKRRGAGEPGGRAAVVIPNGVLSAPGVASRIRAELLTEFNVTAIVRLPHNVFAPYTDIKTNILFFDRAGPTKSILYCEPPIPDGYSLSKTKPLRVEWLTPFLSVIRDRAESDHAWIVEVSEVDDLKNLDIKNPNLKLGELDSTDESLESLKVNFQSLTEEAGAIQDEFRKIVKKMRSAPVREIGQLSEECTERIGDNYHPDIRLLGVSSADGLCDPKTAIGKNTGKYKIIDVGYLAYNPMRINIGSIGVALTDAEKGITSPDYVVFRCIDGLLPEYVFHYLRSEAGRHEINLKTKGSVRFRLYYQQLAQIPIPVPSDVSMQKEFADVCRRLESVRLLAKDSATRAEQTLDALRREAFLEALSGN
jgi:type I restriction enzyme M protein